jgi:hypothetical protein
MRSRGGNRGDGGLGFIRYSDVPDREIEAYWESSDGVHLASGFVTIVAGLRGRGKSSLLALLAALATAGYKDFNPPEPSNVVMVSIEDPIDTVVKPRVLAAGGDPRRVFGRDRLFLPSEKQALIGELITRNAKLCLLDPVYKCMDRRLRRGDNDHVVQVLRSLDEVARATNAAIVGVTNLHGVTRSSSKTAEDAVVGAAAWIDHPRFVAVWGEGVNAEGENTAILAPLKWNPLPQPKSLVFEVGEVTLPGRSIPSPVLSLTGSSEVDANLVWRASAVGRPNPMAKLDACKEFVLHFLSEGKRRVSDLEATAKAAGFSESTLNRARSELGIVAFQEDHAWWVRLPDPPDTLPEDWSF